MASPPLQSPPPAPADSPVSSPPAPADSPASSPPLSQLSSIGVRSPPLQTPPPADQLQSPPPENVSPPAPADSSFIAVPSPPLQTPPPENVSPPAPADSPASSPPPPSTLLVIAARSPPSPADPPAESPPPPVSPASPPPVPTASPPPPPVTPASPPPPPVAPASPPPSPPANPPSSPSPPVNPPTFSSPPSPTANPPPSPPPPADSPPVLPASSPPPPVLPASSPPPPANSPPSPSPPPANSLSPGSTPGPLPSPLPITTTTNDSSPGGGGIGAGGGIGIAIGLVLFFAIGAAFWCLWKRKKNICHILPSSMDFTSSTSGTGFFSRTNARTVSLFTYEELFAATDGFSAQNLLGEGGFGCVYKGHLLDGREVAVKQLKIDASQGEREFRAEVEIISRIHHRHLVTLVGSCISNCNRLLVYNYVSNNTLYYHLHGEGGPVLDWPMRVKIAIGSAHGLAYLHEDCHPRIIHRDIKSSNILIDGNFEAQVADFGLAKFCQDANTHVSTRIMGTFGYMAPEYTTSGKLTEKSDVFSFGVVLLELITGRKPVDTSQPVGQMSLVESGRPLLNRAIETEQFEELVDPRLGNNFVEREMMQLIEVAAACVRHSSTKRPQMGQVVRALDTLATSDLTNGMKVGESEEYKSAHNSEDVKWFRKVAFGSQSSSTDFYSQSTHNSQSPDQILV